MDQQLRRIDQLCTLHEDDAVVDYRLDPLSDHIISCYQFGPE